MTLEERVEAGKKAVNARFDEIDSGTFVITDDIQRALRAAVPELFVDPPTHKLVPVEPTEKMLWAVWFAQAKHAGATDVEATVMTKLHMTDEQRASDVIAYKAMLEASE